MDEVTPGFAIRMYMANMRKWGRMMEAINIEDVVPTTGPQKGKHTIKIKAQFPKEWDKMRKQREDES